MTLKEKINSAILESPNGEVINQIVIISDGYAEYFGKWLRENDDKKSLISELLEIFIKEKGL